MNLDARIRRAWPVDRTFGRKDRRRPYARAHHRYVLRLARYYAGLRPEPPELPPRTSAVTAAALEALAWWAVHGDGQPPPPLYP